MTSIHILLLIHLLGFAALFTATVGGWILHSNYRNANDLQSKILLLKALKPFGVLSPIALLVMIGSGIGNMIYFGIGPLSEHWISAKLVLVAVLLVNGVIFGQRSVRRGKLLMELANGDTSEATRTSVASLDNQIRVFYFVQFVLLLLVLALAVVRP